MLTDRRSNTIRQESSTKKEAEKKFKCKISSTGIQIKCGRVYHSFVPEITVVTGVLTEGLRRYP